MKDKKSKNIDTFEMVLTDLLKWFDATSAKGVVIGGIAMSLLGEARATQDVDAFVFMDIEQVEAFLKAGKKFGFESRVVDTSTFARRSRMLLLQHSSDVEVDISLGALPFEEESFQRKQIVPWRGLSIPVPHPEDLIIMKSVAHRPQDIVDVETLLLVHPNLDFQRIRFWAQEFAKVLEMPEILNDLEKLLKKHTRKKPSKRR